MKDVMHFGKKNKLSLMYIRPFEVLKEVGSITYKMALPPSISRVHTVFHVSMLKKYHEDRYYIIRWDPKLFEKELSYKEELITILD